MNDNDLEIFGKVHALEGAVVAITDSTLNETENHLLHKYKGDIYECYLQLGRVLFLIKQKEAA